MQPLARFPLDAAILFSDILTIPEAMGVGLEFEAGEGPRIERPVRTAADIDRLARPDPERDLRFVLDAVALDPPRAGRPRAADRLRRQPMDRRDLHGRRRQQPRPSGGQGPAVRNRSELHRLLDNARGATRDYLNAQIAAGAQAVMIFDTWGGVLVPPAYREFSLAYMERIVEGLVREHEGRRVPVILFTKGGGAWLRDMAASGCDALGVDWTTDLADARRTCGDSVALQGNLDPSVLYAPPALIRDRVAQVLASYGRGPGHVFNLGHGIHPDVTPEHAQAMVEAVHELSPPYHG